MWKPPFRDWEYWKQLYLCNIGRTSYIRSIEKHFKSPIERIVWLELRFLNDYYGHFNVTLDAQVKIDRYCADFVIKYHPFEKGFTQDNPLKQIVIECDGHEFHEKTKEQAAHDKERDRVMTKMGYIVLRYTGSEICTQPSKIIDDIHSFFNPAYAKEQEEIIRTIMNTPWE